MSVLATYYRITPEHLEQMKQSPAGFDRIMEETCQPEFEERMLDLGKTWDGIHFLLAGYSLLIDRTPRGERELSLLESVVGGGTP